MRTNLKSWQTKNAELFDHLKATSDPNQFDEDESNSTLIITGKLERMVLSNQVDLEFENNQVKEVRAVEQAREELLTEEAGGFDEEDESIHINQSEEAVGIDTLSIQSMNKSGRIRNNQRLVNNSMQTDDHASITTPTRKVKNFVPKIKAAIASTSSQAGITVEQARQAFQASSDVFYEKKYYLNITDVSETAPSTPKHPISRKDYDQNKHVLPSVCVINKENTSKLFRLKKNWVLSILNADPEDNITIHYDTTTRRRIKGD